MTRVVSVRAVTATGLALATLAGVWLTAAQAAGDPIAERQALMKKNGREAKAIGEMLKGTTPYDPAKAAAAANTIAADMKVFITLFPPGSDKGKTEASPKIWQDKAGFEAEANKVIAAAGDAAAAAPEGAKAFGAKFAAVGAGCKSCHQAYRISD